jgi:hypothetical protein
LEFARRSNAELWPIRQKSGGGKTAIDVENMPGHEARLAVVQQEDRGAGNLVR